MKRCDHCQICPACVRKNLRSQQQRDAVTFLRKHPSLYEGWDSKLDRANGEAVLHGTWYIIAESLKAAGIYSKKTYWWDMKVDRLVDMARTKNG